jgi:hypothetical protein
MVFVVRLRTVGRWVGGLEIIMHSSSIKQDVILHFNGGTPREISGFKVLAYAKIQAVDIYSVFWNFFY